MTKIKLIDFTINEDLNKKYLNEIKKFDSKSKNVLMSNDFVDLEKFRSHILSKAGNCDIWCIRQVGPKTEKVLLNLFRKTLKKNPGYKSELKNFKKEYKKLSSYAKNSLVSKGIGLFETFYYVFFIKKQFVTIDYHIQFVKKELETFIRVRCKSIKSISKNSDLNIK